MESATRLDAKRFDLGLGYEQYLASIEHNREDFHKHYDGVSLSQEDIDFFAALGKKLGTRINFLALAEDWCPDVVRGLPVAARVAEACPDVKLRVFPRDQNLDVMDQFLHEGKFRSIPTFVFFDEQFNELGRWAERPSVADDIIQEIKQLQMQNALSEEETRTMRRERMTAIYASVIAPAIIREIKEIFSGNG